mmetsp:Transcript_23632/g.56976  ORF Transcript_23632/g.56976 Transcript_23632/m.56976 type:complete len:244 (+) Transcript_23632:1018-1749(+)
MGWKRTQPFGHLFGCLQPEREVRELRIDVGTEGVRVVHVMLLEPHAARDARDEPCVELSEKLPLPRDAALALAKHAVVHRVVRQEGSLLYAEGKQQGGDDEVEKRRGRRSQEEGGARCDARKGEKLLHERVGEARLEVPFFPQLCAQRAVRRGGGGFWFGIHERADEEGAQLVLDGRRVEQLKLVGGISPRVVKDDPPAGVEVVPVRHIIHPPMHCDPAVAPSAVRAQLRECHRARVRIRRRH